ncbi:ParB/RepB/Spo0J family partition protein [Thaumasiovibrio subtropicus]|uniref:ParB/RepB/Spo0J family partition protein n=1 Tax=Thaumasiovibrio subtropicus TaxID=1891207 RepID=UPI000B35780A|nr:ParB/RepB/Spo0J family partition protein [Thaumasiovibrio subtropicus]
MSLDLSGLNNLNLSEAHTSEPKSGVVMVHPKECYVIEQVRVEIDPEKVKELAASIDEIGIETPIKVYPKDNKGYLIHNGEHRWAAANLLGLTELPVFVDEKAKLIEHKGKKLRSKEAIIGQASDNLHRNELTPLDIAHTLSVLLDPPYSMKKGEIAKSFAKPAAWVSRHLNIADLSPFLTQHVKKGLTRNVEVIELLHKIEKIDSAKCKTLIGGEDLSRKFLNEELKRLQTLDVVSGVDSELDEVKDEPLSVTANAEPVSKSIKKHKGTYFKDGAFYDDGELALVIDRGSVDSLIAQLEAWKIAHKDF